MSCGIGQRSGLNSTLLWLWCRLAAAAAIQPLAWELPYAASVAPQKIRKEKKKKIISHAKKKESVITTQEKKVNKNGSKCWILLTKTTKATIRNVFK